MIGREIRVWGFLFWTFNAKLKNLTFILYLSKWVIQQERGVMTLVFQEYQYYSGKNNFLFTSCPLPILHLTFFYPPFLLLNSIVKISSHVSLTNLLRIDSKWTLYYGQWQKNWTLVSFLITGICRSGVQLVDWLFLCMKLDVLVLVVTYAVTVFLLLALMVPYFLLCYIPNSELW